MSWRRCFGSGRSLGGGRLGGELAGDGVGWRRLPGWVGSVGEAGDRAERGERGRGEQDVIEPAGGAGASGVGDRGAGGGRDRGGYPVPAPEATAAASRPAAPGGAGRPARACRVAVVTREA